MTFSWKTNKPHLLRTTLSHLIYLSYHIPRLVQLANTHYITCNLADAFIQSDLQLIRLGRRHTPWSNVGLRALLKGPTAVLILSWPHHGSNHQPCGSKSSSLAATLQAAPYLQTLRFHCVFSVNSSEAFELKRCSSMLAHLDGEREVVSQKGLILLHLLRLAFQLLTLLAGLLLD